MQWDLRHLTGYVSRHNCLVCDWGLKVGKDWRRKLGGNFSFVTALTSQPHGFLTSQL